MLVDELLYLHVAEAGLDLGMADNRSAPQSTKYRLARESLSVRNMTALA